jgi:hypothetical protein
VDASMTEDGLNPCLRRCSIPSFWRPITHHGAVVSSGGRDGVTF